MNKVKITPRYEEIAYQIADQISEKLILENTKLSGRTLLSSRFNVSSETIRRAVALLANYGVVIVKEQSGVFVVSRERAKLFAVEFKKKQAYKSQKAEIVELMDDQYKIQQQIQKKMKKLMSSNDLFPFDHFTIKLTKDMKHLGQSIKALDFYQHTKALIIAYEYEDKMHQIPDPNTILKEDMILYIMGNLLIKNDVLAFFK